MFYVYILYSAQYDKTYTGYSQDPEQRLLSHNELSPKGWTKRYRPWKLIYTQSYPTKAEALQQEKFLKTGKGREYIRLELLNKLQ
ncbi:GIY-YIG nuclease family protein [Arthrospira platensis SPKY1]|nr:GIY-YIG nuclease family protein [Arthrospira platensis SPKY1]